MRLLQSVTIYLGGGGAKRAIPFLLLPVLTRYLSPEEYGTLAIYQVALGFCAPFVGMGMQVNISRNFSKVDRCELANWIGNLFNVLAVSTCFVSLLCVLSQLIGVPTFGLPGIWFVSVPIVAGLNMVHQINMTVLRNQERPLVFGALEISNVLINMVVSLVLVVLVGMGWQGRVGGIISSAVFFSVGGFFYLRRQGLFSFDVNRQKIKEILNICIPVIPHVLSVAVITMSDRLFIEHMIGIKAVGVYAVGYTFGMIVSLFVESFSMAWSPWFYRNIQTVTTEERLNIVRYSYVYFVSIIVLALLVVAFSSEALPLMVADKYHSATQFVFWVAIGYAFRGMYTMVFPYLVHEARTHFLGVMTAVAAILNLFGNYFLIKLNGPVGAAQSTALAFAVSFLGTWWYASRIHPMPWFGGRA